MEELKILICQHVGYTGEKRPLFYLPPSRRHREILAFQTSKNNFPERLKLRVLI